MHTSNFVDLSGLTADQQAQAGLVCAGVAATHSAGLPGLCAANQLTSSLVDIPAPGTEDDEKNPPRIAHRNLFDLSLGEDNLFKRDSYRVSFRVTAVNLTNKVALYNFLSTFSGTHYVTPRALTAEVGFHFQTLFGLMGVTLPSGGSTSMQRGISRIATVSDASVRSGGSGRRSYP